MIRKNNPFQAYLLRKTSKCLFLNEDLDILYIHGDFDDILKLPNSVARLRLGTMTNKVQFEFLKKGIVKVLTIDKALVYHEVNLSKSDSSKKYSVFFEIVQFGEQAEKIVMITVEPKLVNKEDIPLMVSYDSSHKNKSEYVKRLEAELEILRNELRENASNEKLRINELHSKSKNIMISNEELQSTNEELQSVNEELHTVNAELQHKNKELVVAHNDIQNLLKSTDIGTMFLDIDLNIRKFTPAIRKQFDLLKSDLGRSISTFASLIKDIDIEQLCTDVLKTGDPLKQLVKDHSDVEFLMRISPYKTRDKKIEGIVVTFVDLGKTKSFLQQYDKSIQETAHKFNTIFQNIKSPLLFIDNSHTILSANKEFGKYSVSELVDSNFCDFLSEEDCREFEKSIDKVFTKGEAENVNISLEEKYYYNLNLIPIQDSHDHDKVGSVCIIAIENTETINYLRSVESVRDIYVGIMENARHQMLLLEKGGKIVYLNGVLHSNLNLNDVIGTVAYEYLKEPEKSNYKKAIESIFAGKKMTEISFNYNDKNGKNHYLTYVASPVIVKNEVKYVALIGDPFK